MNGIVKAICIGTAAREPMHYVPEALAIAGQGLQGDRYATGEGSFNKGKQGSRQVTFMNAIFFEGSGFEFKDSRRNIFVEGVELNWLIGREFRIGTARFLGVRYCDPCLLPSRLAGIDKSFKKAFFDCGGIIADVVETGQFSVDDAVIVPSKGY